MCVCVFLQALLKMDCQGLVVRLLLDFVLLTTAVEVASRWRELAEKLARVSKQQMDDYEAPHRDRNGVMDAEVTLHSHTHIHYVCSCSHLRYSSCKHSHALFTFPYTTYCFIPPK